MRSHRARSIAMLVGPALLAGSLAASGATLAAGFEYCDEQGSCAAAIAWTVSGDFKQDDELSGAACATATACLMVNDEKGYAQYFTGVPAYLVVFHIVGAVAVFLAALWFHLGLFATPEARPADLAAEPASATA